MLREQKKGGVAHPIFTQRFTKSAFLQEKPLNKGTDLRPGKSRNIFTGLHGLLRQMGHLLSGKSS